MAVEYYVAWWNLENLFDEENAPPERRTDKVRRALGDDLVGWTPALRDRKVDQLASVIAQMNRGAGPDLLGVCEVENRFVLELLVAELAQRLGGRSYGIAHADTDDARGIDVAFLYDTDRFEVPPGETFFHVVMRRNATRELVQVNFRTRHGGRTWAVFGNHWPSRSGGQFESAGYRHIAGETLAYFHERVLEVHGPETPVLVMGDFNDEPFDVSLVTHALSTRQRNRVLNAEIPLLWNLSWPLIGGRGGQPDGTFYFQNQPNLLDQFLVNRAMADAPLRADETSVEILRFPGTSDDGDYPRPVPFGGMGHAIDEDGFSDHFPLGMRVTEA
ncbi:endonuclease [Aeromicrobium flavum]|uniref:Endonuclease n=1 Tax=Aeromicrobium flavum TaxID=416568 RepID=A0A512HUD5_9ACTN|nr:endonuclease/exonuclease/phosphatase family protein [Aeromicrobium flavum]GEO89066.1 endonuclease [Aeromicrobium flavum]